MDCRARALVAENEALKTELLCNSAKVVSMERSLASLSEAAKNSQRYKQRLAEETKQSAAAVCRRTLLWSPWSVVPYAIAPNRRCRRRS